MFMKIRNVRKSDLLKLYKLEKEIFSYDQISYKSFWWMINGAHRIFKVIEMKNQIIGYVLVLLRSNSSISRLYSLGIHRDYRGKGLAQKMLKIILLELKKNKCDRLCLEVKLKNTKAIKLYRKYGFVLVDQKMNYYSDRSTALSFEKKI